MSDDPEDYAYKQKYGLSRIKPWVFASKAARVRREQIRLFSNGLQFKRPFWNFLWITANIRIVLVMTTWMFFWVFTGVSNRAPFEWMTLFFIAYTSVEVTYWSAVLGHKLVMEHWPKSMKVQVGSMYPLPAGNFVPGAIIRTLLLPESPTSTKMETVTVELVACGYVSGTQEGLTRPNLAFIVAPARFKTASGGLTCGVLLAPNLFYIPAQAEFLVKADMDNWALVSYKAMLSDTFKTDFVDGSVVILAMDVHDIGKPETAPPEISYRRKEFYVIVQRERQVSRRESDYVTRDGDVSAARVIRED